MRHAESILAFRVSEEMRAAIEAYGRSLGILSANGRVNISSTMFLIVSEYLSDFTGHSQLQNALTVARNECATALRIRLQEMHAQLIKEL